MIATAVKGLLTEARSKGVCGVIALALAGLAEPLEMDDPVAIDQTQGDARKTVSPHLFAYERVDTRNIGFGGPANWSASSAITIKNASGRTHRRIALQRECIVRTLFFSLLI
jgi:hypothetical protein